MPAPSKTSLVSLLLLQPILFAVPIIVLGQAIGWPASLLLPGSAALPLIHAHPGAVQAGYWAYLLVSLALVPLAMAMRAWMAGRGMAGWPADALAAVAVMAAGLKMLGIVRWLAAMPLLAARHAEADATGRAMIETAFTALNAYAGAVGELLGVQLASGAWLLGIGAAMLAAGHRVVGPWAMLAGFLFVATCLRTVMPGMAVVQSVAVPLGLGWFIAAAVALGRST